MRTVRYQKAFIQLISLHMIGLSFISNGREGAKGQEGKIAEKKRASEGERERA